MSLKSHFSLTRNFNKGRTLSFLFSFDNPIIGIKKDKNYQPVEMKYFITLILSNQLCHIVLDYKCGKKNKMAAGFLCSKYATELSLSCIRRKHRCYYRCGFDNALDASYLRSNTFKNTSQCFYSAREVNKSFKMIYLQNVNMYIGLQSNLNSSLHPSCYSHNISVIVPFSLI